METITLTFGDCAENHRGMQKIGKEVSVGMSVDDLKVAKKWFEEKGKVCELTDLRMCLPEEEREKAEKAEVLIVKGGCDVLTDVDGLRSEQMELPRDTKAFMYGRVVNKKARHNLCFSDFDQEADYEEGKGTVVSFGRLPHLAEVRKKLGEIGVEKLTGLQCEANYYYDVRKTYIGFHGDTERRIVVAVRLGADFPMHFQWFQKSEAKGELFTRMLSNGDVYFMSEKAVGFDWKLKKKYTLRHAAGDVKIVKSWV
jgi:hypothetical protein